MVHGWMSRHKMMMSPRVHLLRVVRLDSCLFVRAVALARLLVAVVVADAFAAVVVDDWFVEFCWCAIVVAMLDAVAAGSAERA